MRQRTEHRRRVRVPTEDDINQATLDDACLVGFGATKRGLVIYLNSANRKGHIGTVFLDQRGAGYLIAVLKALAPNAAKTPAPAVSLGADGHPEAQAGFLYVAAEDD